jgi:hypothetical protein
MELQQHNSPNNTNKKSEPIKLSPKNALLVRIVSLSLLEFGYDSKVLVC